MSRKDEYLAKAEHADMLAYSCSDHIVRQAMLQAADAWRMLADVEDRWSGPLGLWPDRPRAGP